MGENMIYEQLDTPMKIVEYVEEKLLKQNRKSIGTYGKVPSCLFRDFSDPETPAKCAVGWLIDDSVYRRDMEGTDLSSVIFMVSDKHQQHGQFLENNTDLLYFLMSVHDDYLVLEWPDVFAKLKSCIDQDGNFNLIDAERLITP